MRSKSDILQHLDALIITCNMHGMDQETVEALRVARNITDGFYDELAAQVLRLAKELRDEAGRPS